MKTPNFRKKKKRPNMIKKKVRKEKLRETDQNGKQQKRTT